MLTPAEAHIRDYILGLLYQHRLYNWDVEFDNARNRAGQCVYRTRTIKISRLLLKARGVENTKQTGIHEVAHALTQGANHGPKWKAMYIALGGDGKRCWTSDSVVDEKKIPYRYKGVCPNGHEIRFHRALVSERSCTTCKKGFDRRYLMTFTEIATGRPMEYAQRPTRRNKRRRVVVAR